MNAQIAKEIDAGMKNIAGRPEAAFKLGWGSLGNGITVWNSAKEVSGDYEKVAHIGCDRKIKYYIDNLPAKIIDYIKNIAYHTNPSMSVSQPDQKVFRTEAPTGQDKYLKVCHRLAARYSRIDERGKSIITTHIGRKATKYKHLENLAAVKYLGCDPVKTIEERF